MPIEIIQGEKITLTPIKETLFEKIAIPILMLVLGAIMPFLSSQIDNLPISLLLLVGCPILILFSPVLLCIAFFFPPDIVLLSKEGITYINSRTGKVACSFTADQIVNVKMTGQDTIKKEGLMNQEKKVNFQAKVEIAFPNNIVKVTNLESYVQKGPLENREISQIGITKRIAEFITENYNKQISFS